MEVLLLQPSKFINICYGEIHCKDQYILWWLYKNKLHVRYCCSISEKNHVQQCYVLINLKRPKHGISTIGILLVKDVQICIICVLSVQTCNNIHTCVKTQNKCWLAKTFRIKFFIRGMCCPMVNIIKVQRAKLLSNSTIYERIYSAGIN